MSGFISFSRHTCTLHCLHREKYLEPVTTTAQYTHIMGMWNRRKKVIVVEFCFLYFIVECVQLLRVSAWDIQNSVWKENVFFFKLQCTQYARHHATWDGDLTDCLTTTQKYVFVSAWHSIEYLRSCYVCIFYLSYLNASCMRLNISGLKVAFYSRWPCDGEYGEWKNHLYLPEFKEWFFYCFPY